MRSEITLPLRADKQLGERTSPCWLRPDCWISIQAPAGPDAGPLQVGRAGGAGEAPTAAEMRATLRNRRPRPADANRLQAVTGEEIPNALANLPKGWPIGDAEIGAVVDFAARRCDSVAPRLSALPLVGGPRRTSSRCVLPFGIHVGQDRRKTQMSPCRPVRKRRDDRQYRRYGFRCTRYYRKVHRYRLTRA
jgi:hypothetical protein